MRGRTVGARLRHATSAAICLGALVLSTITAAPVAAVAGFGDVPADEFFTEAVQWMVDRGITTGTSPGCFEPQASTTRAQAATFIHRAKGEPPGTAEPFLDVDGADYFLEAVAWMVSAGITTGTTPTTFEPDRPVTRGEVATLLHRAEGEPVTGEAGFSDVPSTAFYADAVGWMVSVGITTGTSATTFEPDRHVTRAELATFLHRTAGQPMVTLSGGTTCDRAANTDVLASAEAHSFKLLSDLRVGVGAPPLVRVGSMDAFARDWSETMDLSGEFRHSNGPFGENIAWWSAASVSAEAAAQRLHDLWVNSPGHYRNMTDFSYTVVGIGFWQSEDGWHATHVFR